MNALNHASISALYPLSMIQLAVERGVSDLGVRFNDFGTFSRSNGIHWRLDTGGQNHAHLAG